MRGRNWREPPCVPPWLLPSDEVASRAHGGGETSATRAAGNEHAARRATRAHGQTIEQILADARQLVATALNPRARSTGPEVPPREGAGPKPGAVAGSGHCSRPGPDGKLLHLKTNIIRPEHRIAVLTAARARKPPESMSWCCIEVTSCAPSPAPTRTRLRDKGLLAKDAASSRS